MWSAGELVGRAVVSQVGDVAPALESALASHPGSALVYERVVAEGPVLTKPEAAFALSFVQGRDGLCVTLGDRTAYVTPDELLARQAYDKGVEVPGLQLSIGLDTPVALSVAAERLGVTVRDLLDHATLRRFRAERVPAGPPDRPAVTAETLTDGDVRAAAIAAASYLARGVDGQGRYRYLVDAPTNRTLGGYDWPRHAGATYFLAQAAALSGDASIGQAALRAAAYLRGTTRRASAARTAASAMATASTSAPPRSPCWPTSKSRAPCSIRAIAPSSPRSPTSCARSSGPTASSCTSTTGAAGRPVDIQLLYYSGEAALALSRAHALLGDPRDLDAATRALAHLVGPAWSFFGSRYYWGEEHWTCQAMGDLWARAPDRQALDFCIGWQDFTRKLQYRTGDTMLDADGAFESVRLSRRASRRRAAGPKPPSPPSRPRARPASPPPSSTRSTRRSVAPLRSSSDISFARAPSTFSPTPRLSTGPFREAKSTGSYASITTSTRVARWCAISSASNEICADVRRWPSPSDVDCENVATGQNNRGCSRWRRLGYIVSGPTGRPRRGRCRISRSDEQ